MGDFLKALKQSGWLEEELDFVSKGKTLGSEAQQQKMGITYEQAGAELGQAQLKPELGFTSITICCIKLMSNKQVRA